VISLIRFCELTGRELSNEELLNLYRKYPGEQASMVQIKQAAAELNMQLVGVKASLEELAQLDRPCILHIKNPDHFAVLMDVSEAIARLLDGSWVHVYKREELTRLMSGYALVLNQSEAQNAPRGRFKETDYYFGEVNRGQNIEHTFEFKNAGSEDLTLSVVGKSCGCTAALLDGEVVPPGHTGRIKISFQVEKGGLIFETIRLKSNDPLRPIVLLSLRGSAPQELQWTPESLFFAAKKGEEKRLTATLIGPPNMEVKKASMDVPFMEVSPQPRDPLEVANGTWQFVVTLKPEAPVGEWRAELKMETTYEKQPQLSIPIAGRIRGDLRVSPPAVLVPMAQVGRPVQEKITISSQGRKGFQILHVSTKNGAVQVEKPVKVSEDQWEVALTLNMPRRGALEDVVVIETDVEREGKLEIPVSANFVD